MPDLNGKITYEPLVDEHQTRVLGTMAGAAVAIGHLDAIHKLLAQTGRLGRNEQGACEFLVAKLKQLAVDQSEQVET